ncbi:MAG: tetratricopeptide repeat protein [Gemmatimonadota bacterium]
MGDATGNRVSSRPAGGRPRPSLPSVLTTRLTRGLGLALVAAGALLANSAFLVVSRWIGGGTGSETVLPVFYQIMLLSHPVLGWIVVLGFGGFVAGHLPKIWKRRHRGSVLSGVSLVLVGSGLAVSGLFLLTEAASRSHRWAWWLHVLLALAGIAGYGAHRFLSVVRPAPARGRRFAAIVLFLTAVLLAGHLAPGEHAAADATDPPPSRTESEGEQPGVPAAAPVSFVSPRSPFFPSEATLADGVTWPVRALLGPAIVDGDAVRRDVAERGFVVSEAPGAASCERCHPDIVAQWRASAHRFSSFNNPFYEAAVEQLRSRGQQGVVKSRWCAGCHDPVLLFGGRMTATIDRASPAAQAGITCLACHQIQRLHGRVGNGGYELGRGAGAVYLFADQAAPGWRRTLHDAAVRARPEPHRRRFLKPFFRQPEFCATCHKVSLTRPVNEYRWLRGQDEFDNWEDSGVSGNAARAFYHPPEARACRDCHMPLEPAPLGDVSAEDGHVRSHRFVAANTALPFLRNDRDMLERTESFLRDERISVDIFALRAGPGSSPRMGLGARTEVTAGTEAELVVVVRNRGVGHTFPGGTTDSNEAWLEVTVMDGDGRVVAASGLLDDAQALDPMAHVFRTLFVDREGDPVMRRNAQDIRATVYSSLIAPGSATLARYRLRIPATPSQAGLTVRARLLWRKFNRSYELFVHETVPEAFRAEKGMRFLPITEIARDEVRLDVVESPSAAASGEPGAEAWGRFNDYGIGLLAEGNTREAGRAFAAVAERARNRIDGPLNLARTSLQAGDLTSAVERLEKAESMRGGDPRTAFFWGVALTEAGRYEEAEAAYRRVLATFPRDRATWRNLGRTLYLARSYEAALDAFDRVLEIDPEDRIALYHRMLSLRSLGRREEAERAVALYEYHRVDETARTLTRELRSADPGANLMAQPVRVHDLRAP